MNLVERFRWTLISVPVTMLLVVVCVILMGAGHGTYTPTMWLFPYAMLVAIFEDRIGTISIILGLTQYLAYGLIIDFTKTTRRGILIGAGILLLHILIASYVVFARGESF